MPATPPPRLNEAPLDVEDLAVRLETEGVTDEVARARFGQPDVLALARQRWRAAPPEEISPFAEPAPRFWIEYLKGCAFALPVLLSALAVLTFGVSFWGGPLDPDVAAAVAVGTVGSFIVSGGFVQAVANRAMFYLGSKDLGAARSAALRWTRAAVWSLAGSAAVLWALNAVWGWFAFPLNWLAFAFHVALGFFWLSSGILYLLERQWAVAALAAAGIAAVLALHNLLGAPLLVAQLLAICLASVAGAGVAMHLFRAGRSDKPALPAPAYEFHLAAPYLGYGALYYLLLFADRLMAWTSQTAADAVPLRFRGDYEHSLDLALIAFALQAGWVSAASRGFLHWIRADQASTPLGRHGELARRARRAFGRKLLLFLPCAGLISAVVFFGSLPLLPTVPMRLVALAALLGYPALVAGLFSASILFTFGRPGGVVAPLAIAAVADLALGLPLSRIAGPEWAVTGFLAGSWIFGALSAAAAWRRLEDPGREVYAAGI